MFNLPPKRSSWKCQEVNPKNRTQKCEQEIYQSDTLKSQSGKGMVLNVTNGHGGIANQPHVCPYRVGGKHHHFEKLDPKKLLYALQHKFCGMCCQYYNELIMPLCPTCYKLECLECGNRQNWVAGKSDKCSQCGGMFDLRQVFFIWMINAYDEELNEEQKRIRDNRSKMILTKEVIFQ